MAHHLFVVEGPHDAALLGKVAGELGFVQAEKQSELAATPFSVLIPRIYPADKKGKLGHTVAHPDFYRRKASAGDDWLILAVARGDTALVEKFATTLIELPKAFSSAVIIADADLHPAANRFESVLAELVGEIARWNADGQEGMPSILPTQAGIPAIGDPVVAVYVWPDNNDPGNLEDLLLACGAAQFAELTNLGHQTVAAVGAMRPSATVDLKEFNKYRQKATVGIVGSVLHPAASRAVVISKGNWLPPPETAPLSLTMLRNFLLQIVGPA